jgi:hypothetical protein
MIQKRVLQDRAKKLYPKTPFTAANVDAISIE